MVKTTLFVCQSCHHSNTRTPEQLTDGQVLYNLIKKLHQESLQSSDVEIRGVDCLWTCDHPCSIALAGENRSTYTLAKILVKDENHSKIAEAVLQLSQYYLNSKKGNIPWKQFPEILKTEFIARIPPLDCHDLDKAS